MLANGITLGYKASSSATSYTVLTGLKEVPDMGVQPERVDNTTLADTIKHYEMGIGDAGEMQYRFKFVNSAATDSYRILSAITRTTETFFQQTMPDGTKFEFSAYCATRVSGGGVNGVVDFVLILALASDITITAPV